MQIDEMTIRQEEYTLNANIIKEAVLDRLQIDGLISKEKALEYAEKWQVIVVKTNWFQRWCSKFDIKKNEYKYKYVRFED